MIDAEYVNVHKIMQVTLSSLVESLHSDVENEG